MTGCGLTAELADGTIQPIALPAEAGPVPDGTTASQCTACRQTRLQYPGDLHDPWKKHFDYCTG